MIIYDMIYYIVYDMWYEILYTGNMSCTILCNMVCNRSHHKYWATVTLIDSDVPPQVGEIMNLLHGALKGPMSQGPGPKRPQNL